MYPLKYFLTVLLVYLLLCTAFAGDNKNRVEIYRILMPKGDTTFWNANACTLKDDGTFTCLCYYGCSHEEMLANQVVDIGEEIEYSQCVQNRHMDSKIVGDTFYTDLNFGANRKTDYIPYADISKFNRDSIANHFRTIPQNKCSRITGDYSFDYLLEAIGLPEGLVLKSYWDKSPYIGEYSVFWRKNVCEFDSSFKLPHINPRRWQPNHEPHCDWRNLLKDKTKRAEYHLFNTRSVDLPDTTFTWKLIYKDQYGRGDTLKITTTVK